MTVVLKVLAGNDLFIIRFDILYLSESEAQLYVTGVYW
jgi:hypothetical protein